MSGRSVAVLIVLLMLPGSVQAQPQLLLNSQFGDFVGQGGGNMRITDGHVVPDTARAEPVAGLAVSCKRG